MMHAKYIPLQFWAKALNTMSHIHNTVSLRLDTSKINYAIWKCRKLNVKYFHIFGSQCHILEDREAHHKWYSKSDRGIFLRYSTNSRVYRVFNKRTKVVMESINVIVHDLIKERDDDDDVFIRRSVQPAQQ